MNVHFNYGMTGFDDIFEAMFSVLQFLTGEGWSFQMYIMWNHFNKAIVIAYFASLIIVGVFFAFNLFIAVLCDSYVNVLQDNEQREMKE